MGDEAKGASLEDLLETGLLQAEILHPGGLEITKELAELCQIGSGRRVLDVASGSGEAACFIAETFQATVVGVDGSEFMVERAREKAGQRKLSVEFQQSDAHNLPFADNTFDAVISECTTCILDKLRAIREMVRVTKPGGYVGIHDLCWKPHTTDHLKRRLAELESERPETLDGWKTLFQEAGLTNVVAVDKSPLIASWTKHVKKQLGLGGQLRLFLKVIRRWGFRGLLRVKESEGIFRSASMGYGLIVGKRPDEGQSGNKPSGID